MWEEQEVQVVVVSESLSDMAGDRPVIGSVCHLRGARSLALTLVWVFLRPPPLSYSHQAGELDGACRPLEKPAPVVSFPQPFPSSFIPLITVLTAFPSVLCAL